MTLAGRVIAFFRSISHQLFGTSDEHMQVRLAGVDNMQAYLRHYIEFNVDSSWSLII